ncbi:hypothetical protein J3458_009406 [Metarhizium acridum]|uniref:uncharacterized protein n=1 Tax=Metarhizium acridum TaxID=92637 RepID=UPI001C6C6E79|nr:hypothetical protein J3458_009406 [Metarhizium acridum]
MSLGADSLQKLVFNLAMARENRWVAIGAVYSYVACRTRSDHDGDTIPPCTRCSNFLEFHEYFSLLRDVLPRLPRRLGPGYHDLGRKAQSGMPRCMIVTMFPDR